MTTDFSNLSAEQKKAAGRALIKRHREIWPGAGWPDLETAIDLVRSAMTAVNAYGAGQADAVASPDHDAAGYLVSASKLLSNLKEPWPVERHLDQLRCDTDQTSHVRQTAGLALHAIRNMRAAAIAVNAHPPAASARIAEMEAALRDIADLYDSDEGCRSTPEYIAARAALAGGRTSDHPGDDFTDEPKAGPFDRAGGRT
jgi:hypothetical protein